ncbi:MAG: TraR/DksA C4-type zinc finger protein [Deltaproteobacteria bacterium]|nr:TraR/DksA C4-type zinc finger protein [Deltaproteobacteria bacterium]
MNEKNKLLNEVSLKVKGESEGAKTEIGDIYDIASFERERELTLMLGDRERGKLVEIDKALERLNGKDYGVCEECGEPIGENRLMAMPFTMVCVDCKTRAEKELLIKGKVEEEPSFGILEKTEPEEEF